MDQDARIKKLESTVWTLWCCLQTAQEVLPPSHPVPVVINAAEEHCVPVAVSVLDRAREAAVA